MTLWRKRQIDLQKQKAIRDSERVPMPALRKAGRNGSSSTLEPVARWERKGYKG